MKDLDSLILNNSVILPAEVCMSLILGSQSPRRKEILHYFSIPFRQVPSDFDEHSISFRTDPVEYASSLSREKALLLSKRFPQETILTADTIVFCQGKILNKPEDKEKAASMLRALSGTWHEVITSVSLFQNSNLYTEHETTRLLFHPLTEEQIALYHQQDPCLDKAGAYTIQGVGALLVHTLQGCYYNVLGLPINVTKKLLLHAGIDLWHHLTKQK